MDKIKQLIQRVQKTQHGFLDIQKTANEVVDEYSAKDSLIIAKQLFSSEIHQSRSLANFYFGPIGSKIKRSSQFYEKKVNSQTGK